MLIVIPKKTTKKTKKYTEKERGQSKWYITKNQVNTKKVLMEELRNKKYVRHTENS